MAYHARLTLEDEGGQQLLEQRQGVVRGKEHQGKKHLAILVIAKQHKKQVIEVSGKRLRHGYKGVSS